ncbi:MAG: NAD(P)/FAD-dependent oxidoreductase [Microthrixaceae bacterium]
MAAHRHRVVVVGAGFGGLTAAKGLADAPVDVTVVDARNHHTFQPLLYQVATAVLDSDDVCHPVRGIFHRQPNATVRLGTVSGVDFEDHAVELADGTRLPYDDLVLACGAVTADFGVPGVAEHAFGLKSLHDALRLRTHVLAAFEEADARPELIDGGLCTVVIAGGGPTGVELAGGMAELFTKVLARDHPTLDIRRARVVLIEATDRVLGTFAPKLGREARDTLEALGVEVMLNTTLERVDADGVLCTNGEHIPCHTMIWAAGVRANPIAEALGVATTRGGRIVVEADLTLPGRPEVFVIGDLAAPPPDDDGGLTPQVAPAAIQGGSHVAATIRARLHGEPTGEFRYRDKGSMATIGRHDAVTELPNGLRLKGTVGWVAWLALHLYMLIGFRNRANVMVNWAWNYLTYDRASRIIVDGP